MCRWVPFPLPGTFHCKADSFRKAQQERRLEATAASVVQKFSAHSLDACQQSTLQLLLVPSLPLVVAVPKLSSARQSLEAFETDGDRSVAGEVHFAFQYHDM